MDERLSQEVRRLQNFGRELEGLWDYQRAELALSVLAYARGRLLAEMAFVDAVVREHENQPEGQVQ